MSNKAGPMRGATLEIRRQVAARLRSTARSCAPRSNRSPLGGTHLAGRTAAPKSQDCLRGVTIRPEDAAVVTFHWANMWGCRFAISSIFLRALRNAESRLYFLRIHCTK